MAPVFERTVWTTIDAVKVNVTALTLGPIKLLTTTGSVWGAIAPTKAGVIPEISVLEMTLKFNNTAPLTVAVVAVRKFSPVRVTWVPPDSGPDVGVIALRTGAALGSKYVNPFGKVTAPKVVVVMTISTVMTAADGHCLLVYDEVRGGMNTYVLIAILMSKP